MAEVVDQVVAACRAQLKAWHDDDNAEHMGGRDSMAWEILAILGEED